MALIYPTQALRVAASAPVLSILHFEKTDGSQWGPTYQTAVRNYACLRPQGRYSHQRPETSGKVEYNFTAIIRARARCALPMPKAFHPVAWLHILLDSHTGTVDSFAGWGTAVVTVIQRLGGRKRGEAPGGLHYPYVCDTSRMYCNRAEPRVHTARILEATTCWSRREIVDLAVDQLFQRLKTTKPSAAREPNKRTLSISTEVPSNPRAALEIFPNLRSRQKERGQSVGEVYARGVQTFKSLFVQDGPQELADSLKNWPT